MALRSKRLLKSFGRHVRPLSRRDVPIGLRNPWTLSQAADVFGDIRPVAPVKPSPQASRNSHSNSPPVENGIRKSSDVIPIGKPSRRKNPSSGGWRHRTVGLDALDQ